MDSAVAPHSPHELGVVVSALSLSLLATGCMNIATSRVETVGRGRVEVNRIPEADPVNASWDVRGSTLNGALSWGNACKRVIREPVETLDVTVKKPDVLQNALWLAGSVAAVGGAVYIAAAVVPNASSDTSSCDASSGSCSSSKTKDEVYAGLLGAAGLIGMYWAGATLFKSEHREVKTVGETWRVREEPMPAPCARQEALVGTVVTLNMTGFDSVSGTVDRRGRLSLPLPEGALGRRPAAAEANIALVPGAAASWIATGRSLGSVDLSAYAASAPVPTATPTPVEDPRLREEAEWVAARPIGCKLPASLSACDAVQVYLAAHPQGVHAEEGRDIVGAAQPKLEQLQKDENGWKKAGVESCRLLRNRNACIGVELYVTKYPAGLHADEARDLLLRR
jgi:hypothetical protein